MGAEAKWVRCHSATCLVVCELMRSKRLWVGPLVALGVLFFAGSGELVLRRFSKVQLPLVLDELNLVYRYDRRLGWFPREDSQGSFVGDTGTQIHYQHNHEGFRDREHGEKQGRRMVFLGDSLVWGYDVEVPDRFTEKVQAGLTDWELLNLGVSGYGTDQEFILLRKYFHRVNPDVVVLLFNSNDHLDNSSNQRNGYYKPYFALQGDALKVSGVPVPKSINYYYSRFPWLAKRSYLFRGLLTAWNRLFQPDEIKQGETTFAILRAMRSFIHSRGATFVVAAAGKEPELEGFCEREKIIFLKLPEVSVNGSGHWSAEGHSAVARSLLEKLPTSGSLGVPSKSQAIENTNHQDESSPGAGRG